MMLAPRHITPLLLLPLLVVLTGCLGMPADVRPVTGFDLDRYLGTWYEIARLDHSFERGLSRVTATYSKRDDGGVAVVNRGFDVDSGEFEQAQGRAYFVETPDTGYLKVSFFGPFYGSYVIFELDDDYQYAFIAGNNTSYLWLLSRTPEVPPALLQRFRERARALGFDANALIMVEHGPAN